MPSSEAEAASVAVGAPARQDADDRDRAASGIVLERDAPVTHPQAVLLAAAGQTLDGALTGLGVALNGADDSVSRLRLKSSKVMPGRPGSGYSPG